MSTPGETVSKIFLQRKAKLYALALDYAGRAITMARADKKWTDRTSQAVDRMFAKAFTTDDDVGFFLSHGVFYGVYLELANDRAYEIIRPVISELGPKFIADAKEIY
jgi:hypothetical protein